MTPNELLEEVTGRFTMLLHDEPKSLAVLLKQAVGKYQDLAGFMSKVRIAQTDIVDGLTALPERFQTRIALKDAAGRFVPCDAWSGELEVKLSGAETYPLTLMYFENVRSADFDLYQLPPASVALIADYLELLIASPNAIRQRRIAIAGKLDTSDIPTEESLAARKAELEERIKGSRAILPTISLF